MVRFLKESAREIDERAYDVAKEVEYALEDSGGLLEKSDVNGIIRDYMDREDTTTDFFVDVYSVLTRMGIYTSDATGEVFTSDYADEHPEMLRESKRLKKSQRRLRERFDDPAPQIMFDVSDQLPVVSRKALSSDKFIDYMETMISGGTFSKDDWKQYWKMQHRYDKERVSLYNEIQDFQTSLTESYKFWMGKADDLKELLEEEEKRVSDVQDELSEIVSRNQ